VGGLVAGLALGSLADGSGPARQRAVVRFAGVATLVALGVAIVVWRTADLRAMPGFDRAVAQVFAFFS
jgi:energy-converting hydrogenase Eha subunit E